MTHAATKERQCRESAGHQLIRFRLFLDVTSFRYIGCASRIYFSVLFLNVFRDSLKPEEERRDTLHAGRDNASEDAEIRSWMPAIS